MKTQPKEFLTYLIVICAAVFFSGQTSSAATLSFLPSGSVIGIGETVGLNIVVSDVGVENDLGGFDFNVSYDADVLSFSDYVLGTDLGNSRDTGLGDNGGTINLAAYSLEWDLSSQPDTFTLATLSFSGNSVGNSSFLFSQVTLGDFSGDPLSANLETGNVNVIPIPGAVWLFASGLAGLVGIRKRLKK
jgi:hypothetical protein